MFYKEDDVESVLNCPRCKERFDKPMIVPCFETLCFKCVQELSVSDHFECFFCNEKHQIPKAGFKSNTAIEKLLKVQPKQVYRNNQLIKKLEDKLAKFTSLHDEFSTKANGLESALDDHCASLRNQIDLATDEKIEQINQIRDKFLKQVDDYKYSCLKNIQNKKNRFDEKQKESIKFIKNCKCCLKEFEIDDATVNQLSFEVDRQLKHVNLEMIYLENVKFNGKKMNFERLQTSILDESVGKFSDTELEDPNNDMNHKIVSSSSDKTLKLWDVSNSECIQTFTGHKSFVSCIGVLSESAIISGSGDKTLKIWNLIDGSCVKTLEGHTDTVYCLSVIDSNTVASGSNDKTIKIWNLENLENAHCVKTFGEHSGEVNCLCVIDKNQIVSASCDMTLKVWDLDEGKCKITLNGHSDIVHGVSKLDNSRIVSASIDKTLKIWDIDTGKCLETLKGHTELLYCVLAIDKNTIVSGSKDKTIKIWNLDEKGKGKCIKTLHGHTDSIRCLLLTGSNLLLSGSIDKTVRIWNLENDVCIRTLEGHKSQISCLASVDK